MVTIQNNEYSLYADMYKYEQQSSYTTPTMKENKMKKVSIIETLDELVAETNSNYEEGKTNTRKMTMNYVAYFDSGTKPYKTDFVHVVNCARCGTLTISNTENTDNNENMEICSDCTYSVLNGIHQKALKFWKKELKKAKKATKKAKVKEAPVSEPNPNKWGEPIDLELPVLELDSPIVDWSRPVSFSRDENTGAYIVKFLDVEPVETEWESCHE